MCSALPHLAVFLPCTPVHPGFVFHLLAQIRPALRSLINVLSFQKTSGSFSDWNLETRLTWSLHLHR